MFRLNLPILLTFFLSLVERRISLISAANLGNPVRDVLSVASQPLTHPSPGGRGVSSRTRYCAHEIGGLA